MKTKRITEMVENWKKEGRAFSNVKNNDEDFFEIINKKKSSIGIASQTGSDLIYYDTNFYNSDSNAIKGIKKSNEKLFVLQTESGYFISEENEWHHAKQVSKITESTKYNYNEAVKCSNLLWQISDLKLKLVEVGSDYYHEMVYKALSLTQEQNRIPDHKVDYSSRY